MTPEELSKRKERVVTENLIVSEVEEGFRVYSPNAPRRVYLVSRDPAAPTCTCPDFGHHAQDPEWRCKHILAVYDDLGASASGSEGRAERPPSVGGYGNGGDTSMLIKRSVSPDGRIDALSVEFSCPVDTGNGEVQHRAAGILGLQAEIVSRFLDGGGSSSRHATEPSSNGAIPSTIVEVGGTDGKYGRRLFLTFKANGRNLRLYGTQKKLAEAIHAAGHGKPIAAIQEGVRLNLPCRIVTEPTHDGRYLNIEAVLPPDGAGVVQ